MVKPTHIILFHGLEGGPDGRKLNTIADDARTLGMEAHIPDHRATRDPDERLAMAREAFKALLGKGNCILAGSSMGGYVAASLACEFDVAGLLLMAPALYRAGYARQDYPVRTRHALIIHGTADDVVGIETSRRFMHETPGTVLVEVQDDHRLQLQVDSLPALFRYLLARMAQ